MTESPDSLPVHVLGGNRNSAALQSDFDANAKSATAIMTRALRFYSLKANIYHAAPFQATVTSALAAINRPFADQHYINGIARHMKSLNNGTVKAKSPYVGL